MDAGRATRRFRVGVAFELESTRLALRAGKRPPDRSGARNAAGAAPCPEPSSEHRSGPLSKRARSGSWRGWITLGEPRSLGSAPPPRPPLVQVLRFPSPEPFERWSRPCPRVELRQPHESLVANLLVGMVECLG